MGDTVQVESSTGAADLTLNTADRTTDPPSEFSSPPENGVFLVVDVTFVGTSGQFDVSPGFFEVQDAAGYVYDAYLAGFEPELPSTGVIAPGSVRGR